jgi:hypothetical protein
MILIFGYEYIEKVFFKKEGEQGNPTPYCLRSAPFPKPKNPSTCFFLPFKSIEKILNKKEE